MVLALILIFVGPWLVYVLCPVPDQLAEYRNYSMCAGFALGLALLLNTAPWAAWFLVLAGFAVSAAMKASNYRTAERFWTASQLTASGDRSRALQWLGALKKVEGKFEEAEEYYRDAIRLNPNLGAALTDLGWCLIQAQWEKQDAAKEPRTLNPEGRMWLEQCTKRCPDYPPAWQDWGNVLFNEGDREGARRCFDRVLELEPQNPGGLNMSGVLAFLRGQKQEAVSLFQRAYWQHPQHWEFVYNLSVSLKHVGELDEAQRFFKMIPQPFPVTHNMIPMEFAK